jgi:branched-chain amino acid transport system substrate-binding protein
MAPSRWLRTAGVRIGIGVAALPAAVPVHADEAYRIGALFPISGPMAVFGDAFRAGADLAAEHVRADNRLGRPIEIRYEDSQGQVQPTLIGMNKLARQERLPYVMIGLASASKMVAPIVEREKVIAVNGSASTPDLGHLSGFFWNVIPLADFEIRQLLPVAKQRGVKRVALVYTADPRDQVLARALQDAVGAADLEVAGSFAVEPYDIEFTELAGKLREAQPDAVYIAVAGIQQRDLVQQLRDGGIDKPLLGTSAFQDPDIIGLPAADGALFTSQRLSWQARDPITQRFVKDFEARTRREPTAYAANYYNAVLVYAGVVQDLEQRQVAPSGEAIREALQRIRRFDVVGGTLEFQPDGTAQLPVQVNQIAGGTVKALN